jgi:hypothetical protein
MLTLKLRSAYNIVPGVLSERSPIESSVFFTDRKKCILEIWSRVFKTRV